MSARSLILFATSIWAIQGAANTIEIDGRRIKLQPKPTGDFWQASPDTLRNLPTLELPAKVDLSEMQTPVKDQGQRGSCAYFTTVALFEQALKQYYPDRRDLNLSEEYLIYANKALDRVSTKDDASSLSANIRSFMQRGFLLEEAMPYTHSWFEKGLPCENYEDDKNAPLFCRSHFGPNTEAQKQIIDATKFSFQLSQPASIQAVKTRLAEGAAVTISVPVNQNGWNGEAGRVEHNTELEAECKTEPDLCGGHTVLLTGFNEEDKVFYFKNSWGKTWGQNGYGQMPYEFVENWSYGSFTTAKVKRLDVDLNNQTIVSELSPVTSEVKLAFDEKGTAGVEINLQFTYTAPLGTFYYVSLFPQLKIIGPETDQTTDPIFEAVYTTQDDGSRQLVSDRRFVLSQNLSDLAYGPEKPFKMFISFDELQRAGVKDAANLVLRPSIYKMDDSETYKILFRDYLSLPAH